MNFYSASVALLWTTVFGAVTPPSGSWQSASRGRPGGHPRSSGCKLPATPESTRSPCQTPLKREVLP